MEQDSLEIINIAGKPWEQVVLKEKEDKYSSKSYKVTVYDYTLSDNVVIFVKYDYKSDKDSKESLSPQTQEINKMLSGFNFEKKQG